jgi:prevent-host-death family protein
MEKITFQHAREKFDELFDKVSAKHQPVEVTSPNGESVKIIPVPKPIRYWKGKPVYRAEDVQFLYPEFPFLLEG